MKKIFIVLLILTIFIFAGCEKAKEIISDVDGSTDHGASKTDVLAADTTEEPTVEDTTEPDEVIEDEPLTHIDLSFLIELDWPEVEESYADEVKFKAFPLTRQPIYLTTSLVGDMTFVDEKLNRINLPFQPSAWVYIDDVDYETDTAKPIAYALKESPDYYDETTDEYIRGDFILMLANGIIPRDSDGDYIKLAWGNYNSYYIFNNGNAVITRKDESFGLYDVKKQQEILPCEYELVSPFDEIFYVIKDGQGFLYNKSGNELYSFGEVEMPVYDDLFLPTPADYYLSVKEHLFYKVSDFNSELSNVYGSISLWGEYTVSLHKNGYVYVTDRDGKILYRSACFRYEITNEYLVLYTAAGFVIVNTDFIERKFPVKLSQRDYPYFYEFDGNGVFYSEKHRDREIYFVDETGNVLETEKVGKFGKYDEYNGPMYFEGGYHYEQGEYGNISLRDEQEKSYGLKFFGNFAFFRVWAGEENFKYTIFSLDGKLLLKDIYGVVDSPMIGEGIFVYVTPDNCVVLYPDGKTVPVHVAPVVTQYGWE